MSYHQTIFAPASALGKAGVAVFRISGPDAMRVFEIVCRPQDIPAHRTAVLRDIIHPQTTEHIDKALVLFFPCPHSFTGEDVVEIHAHGGRAVSNAILECLQTIPNFRLAQPGEFTRRAFENGKLDLTEAEAIADLVHAETEAQRKQALRQLNGALGRLYEGWRSQLSQSLAYMEAAIDFSEEELPFDVIDKHRVALMDLKLEIEKHLNDGHRGERMREGYSIALLGAPNAGKSSLLNVLAKRDAAIVSPVAGTTRDVIEVYMDIKGYAVRVADTAGLRASLDDIETEGVRRAHLQAEQADLKIIVIDGALWPEIDEALRPIIDADAVIVVNKADLIEGKPPPLTVEGQTPFFVSAIRGDGMSTLVEGLATHIERRMTGDGSPPLTRARHRDALQECVDHLERAAHAELADLRAEDVRMAVRALGRITGRIDVEDLLDIIFRDFCIGK